MHAWGTVLRLIVLPMYAKKLPMHLLYALAAGSLSYFGLLRSLCVYGVVG